MVDLKGLMLSSYLDEHNDRVICLNTNQSDYNCIKLSGEQWDELVTYIRTGGTSHTPGGTGRGLDHGVR